MVFRKIFFALLVAFTFTACTTNDPIIDNQVKTDGALTVQLTTSTYNGEYSPEHVLAIWIESNNGTFVKSLKVGAAERKKISDQLAWFNKFGKYNRCRYKRHIEKSRDSQPQLGWNRCERCCGW